MRDCLSQDEVTDLLSDAVVADRVVTAHLGQCSDCLAVVDVALRAHVPTLPMRFAVLRQLGAGGMGTVYEALDRAHGTHVALKVLQRVSPDAILRFKREFRALQSLEHPNLVRLGELVADGEQWAFTMELLDGVAFVEHVRGHFGTTADTAPALAGYDDARLRDGLAQLVRGVLALHAAGKVHRDIKSSNVLVTHAGRVVLLDLGLVLDRGEPESSGGHALGTIPYMAPEQALGERVGPEADWYAVGVLLYQVLTGELPFTGNAVDMTLRKRRGPPVPPRDRWPSIDPALSDLCVSLLAPDPAARATGEDILRVLGHTVRAAPASPAVWTTDFIGRGRELKLLRQALDDTRRGEPVAVLVTGESGIGKTALVQRFAEACRSEGAVVLVGRCYERESLPFKALDGIVDALGRHLARMPELEVVSVLPRHAALLARAFPVLAGVRAIAAAPHGFEVPDPQELRSRLFDAFRELLARLADRHPVLLIVDDAHWADVDSFALLAELFRQPDAPAVLLVAMLRPTGNEESAHLAAARRALGTQARTLALPALTAEDARALAALLIAQHAEPSCLEPAAVASEAGGHPLFIAELVRHDRVDAGPVRLDDVLWDRIGKLAPEARAVLLLAALSGGRLMRRVAERACGLPHGAFEHGVSVLRAANLARTGGSSDSDRLEPYHDRVRAAVLAHTSEDDARTAHRWLALALEAEPEADPEALVLHWREAGEAERAATYASEAAARAARTLAFDRAAQWYSLALELRAAGGPRDPAAEHALRVSLGHALANAGRGGEAATAYLAAAETAGVAESSDLRRCAAEQLMRNGHLDEGIATLRTALQPLGVAVATRPAQALGSLLVRRLKIRLRGLRYRERDAADVPARLLTRIDFLWSISSSLGFADPLLGSVVNALHFLLALRAGEPSRLCRAIAAEAVYSATVGAAARVRRMQERAHELARRVDQPYTDGVLAMCDGISAVLLGEFAKAQRTLDDAQQILRDATGVAWEIETAQNYELGALAWMGRFEELRRRVPRVMREADARGNLYISAAVRTGLANGLIQLQRDQVAQARGDAAEGLARWPQRGFRISHYWNLYTNAQIDLYEGDAGSAHARMTRGWPSVKAALQLRVQFSRVGITELRIRCLLAAARQRARRAPSEAHALLDQSRREIRLLTRERVGWASALAGLLEAGMAHLRGDATTACDQLAQAIAALDAAGLALFATAARRRLAQLCGGDRGAELSRQAAAWFTHSGVVRPDAMTAMLTPAFEPGG